MSNFPQAFLKLVDAEYSANPEDFLHQNTGENDITLGGIYRVANPLSFDWQFVDKIIHACNGDIQRASIILYSDSTTKKHVFEFFKEHYWDIIRLSEVQDQNMAEEIFLMGVVSHPITAVKLAQRLVRTKPDGIIGTNTLKALNIYNPQAFDKQYDNFEKKHFDLIIERNPKLAINKRGWYNRAVLV